MDTLKTQYNGIEITYHEKNNIWIFEHRGRERRVESLAQAKDIIAKPVKADKPPFTRVKAYTERSYDGSGFQTVEVTSIADTQSWAQTEYWVVTDKKNRQKMSASSLYPVNSKNDSLVTQIGLIDKQSAELAERRAELKNKLQQMPAEK